MARRREKIWRTLKPVERLHLKTLSRLVSDIDGLHWRTLSEKLATFKATFKPIDRDVETTLETIFINFLFTLKHVEQKSPIVSALFKTQFLSHRLR